MEILDAIGQVFQTLFDFFHWLINDFFAYIISVFIKLYTWVKINFMYGILKFAFSTALYLIENLKLSEALAHAWNELDYDVYQMLLYFRIPECINILMSAYVTRFVLTFIPMW